MEHQDWDNIIIHNPLASKERVLEKKQQNKAFSQKEVGPEEAHLEASKLLGQLISQARTLKGKTQKEFATELSISSQILSRWESNKEIPTNAQIALIEKKTGIKLPRAKKVKNLE